ncbi:MAG: hypothetical protein KJO82_11115 [Gammaproteobacteria bacterium]|nr:hypothetical protein [Gammaproteobacteria bacterium]
MDLSFQEKGAWGVLAGLLVVAAFYFPAALDIVDYSGNPIALIAISIVGVVVLVVIEIVYHMIVALSGDTESDERDALIDLRAERNGGLVLGLSLFILVGHIVAETLRNAGEPPNGLLLAVYIIGALTVSEVAKLASQIWYYRIGRL